MDMDRDVQWCLILPEAGRGNTCREHRQGTLNWELLMVNIDNYFWLVKQTDLSPQEICADQTGTAVYIITSPFFFFFSLGFCF